VLLAFRSLKSLLANSSSHEISGMRPSTSEDEERFITGAFLKGSLAQTPVSLGSVRRPSTGTPAMVVNLEGVGDGVGAPLGDGLPSLVGERAHLVPLLSSIDRKRKERRNVRWLSP
jgi:hypothetical protein